MSCTFREGDIVGHPKVNNRGTVLSVSVRQGKNEFGEAPSVRVWASVAWEGTVTCDGRRGGLHPPERLAGPERVRAVVEHRLAGGRHMKWGKQVVFCNACGKRHYIELTRMVGRDWKVCDLACLQVMETRYASCLLGVDATLQDPTDHAEDPGTCFTCGKSYELVRPGKSQPTCTCDETSEGHSP